MAMGRWWAFNANNVALDRDDPATYELGNQAGVIYIGSSATLKTRLQRHLNSTDACIRSATHYRYDYRNDYKEEETRRYDAFVRANGRAPRCNDVRP